MQRRHPGLAPWHGITGLAKSLRHLAGATAGSEVLFANRSASLMKLAVWKLVAEGRPVVTVDLLWPPYRRILTRICREADATLTVVRLREKLLGSGASPLRVRDVAVDACRRLRSPGLVLPAVTHRGVRLPIPSIVTSLRAVAQDAYVVVDAAQVLGQERVDFTQSGCDLLLAGADKWLGGYHPLGFAIAADAGFVAHAAKFVMRRRVTDPLLQLVCELRGPLRVRHGETASLVPLLSAQGAVCDALRSSPRQQQAVRLRNRRAVVRLLKPHRWRETYPRESCSSGVLYVRRPNSAEKETMQRLRYSLRRYQISCTIYPDGGVRLALPDRILSRQDLTSLSEAFRSIE